MKEGTKIFTIAHVSLNGKLSDSTNKYHEYCLVFLHEILRKQSALSKRDSDRYVTFSFDKRIKLLPKYWIASIEKDLISLELIEKDSTYSKDTKKAQGFRLTNKFFEHEMCRYALKEKLVSKRLCNYRNTFSGKEDYDSTYPVNVDIVNQSKKFSLKLPEYTVSSTATSDSLDGTTYTYDSNKTNCSCTSDEYHYVYQFLEKPKAKKEDILRLSRAYSVLDSTDFFTRKNNNDRFYLKWQLLPKDFRQYIKLANNPLPLVEVDVSCSQPVILGGLTAKKLGEMTPDLKEYLDLVKQGDIYDAFEGYTRDQVKKGFMYILFGEKVYDQYSALYQTLEKRFPTVINFLNDLKSKDYHDSSILLRKTEAQIILNDVCKQLSLIKASDFGYLTIHDSIIVPANYAKLCSKLLKTAYKESIGLECHVKTKAVTSGELSLQGYLQLPEQFKLNGFDYSCLCSNVNVSLYEQVSGGGIIGYEIHKNRKKRNILPSGVVIEKLMRPSSSQWGKLGKTKKTLRSALNQFSEWTRV